MIAKLVVDGGERQIVLKPETEVEKVILEQLLGGIYEMDLRCSFAFEAPAIVTPATIWVTLKASG